MSQNLEIKAQNIKCGGCAATIENGLKPLPGIEQVSVEIDSGLVRITGSELSEQQIRDKLSELGYPAID